MCRPKIAVSGQKVKSDFTFCPQIAILAAVPRSSPLAQIRGHEVKSRERGAAAVEMALVLPVLLLIIFGIVDFGRMLNAQITITQAAREGARVAAVGGAQTAVNARVQLATPGMTVTSPITTACTGVNSPTGVTVSHTFSYVTPFGALMRMFGSGPGGSTVLTATGVMACQQ
jgi:Flp pilus assembly protein TadG